MTKEKSIKKFNVKYGLQIAGASVFAGFFLFCIIWFFTTGQNIKELIFTKNSSLQGFEVFLSIFSFCGFILSISCLFPIKNNFSLILEILLVVSSLLYVYFGFWISNIWIILVLICGIVLLTISMCIKEKLKNDETPDNKTL